MTLRIQKVFCFVYAMLNKIIKNILRHDMYLKSFLPSYPKWQIIITTTGIFSILKDYRVNFRTRRIFLIDIRFKME